MHDASVSISNLSFFRQERAIFDDISLTIPKGKITAIMGPSGTGKTTLLRLIAGQIAPESGSISFEGTEITQASRNELFQLRKRMSMLFQSGALFTDMTVYDNVAFPLREHTKLSEEFIHTLVMLKLEAVGLRGAYKLMPSELSGGMARRAALARAIALDPCLIMYDEPFAGQDPLTMGVLVTLIRRLNQALGATSVVVTHDVPEVMSIADHVYILAEGKVIASGSPDELRANKDPLVVQFLTGLADGPVPFRFPSAPIEKDLFQHE
ncbi:MAG: ATP-binding cassette domain-containing protein [Vibrio sp.]